jgi:hypothetical protein
VCQIHPTPSQRKRHAPCLGDVVAAECEQHVLPEILIGD